MQVADVAVGFRELEHKTLDEVRAIADAGRFDYYCWDLYARVTEWYEGDKERLKIRAAALHDIERGGNETAALAALHRRPHRPLRICETMARMNIGYDLLTWEGDILRLHFWTHAFEFLKKTGAVFLQTEGKLKGCWVMRIDDDPERRIAERRAAAARPDPMRRTPAKPLNEPREKVIVRSDGTVTYVGKDMAYQLWKFGLLGKDFHYRVLRQRPAAALVDQLRRRQPAAIGAPAFGRASWVCNVIDTRQSYLQKLLKQALAALGYHEQAAHSVHYSYEMVALSHATARELGYDTAVDADRPFVEVSGRKGLGVKADDLLDRLTDKAAAEVAKRNAELPAEDDARDCRRHRDRRGALLHGEVLARQDHRVRHRRGAQLRRRKRPVPAVRRRARQQHLPQAAGARRRRRGRASSSRLPRTSADVLDRRHDEAHDLWGLVLEAARLDEVVEQAVRTLELSVLAKYAFGLAQAFNGFYHKYSILNEERDDVRIWRAAAVAYYRSQLTRALELMGCDRAGQDVGRQLSAISYQLLVISHWLIQRRHITRHDRSPREPEAGS